MSQHHPARAPGGARGEQDRGRIIVIGAVGHQRRTLRHARQRIGCGQVHHRAAVPARYKRIVRAGIGQHQDRGHFLDHRDQFGRCAPAVEQRRHPARGQHRQERDHPFGAVVHADRHALPAAIAQPRGQRIAPGKQVGKAGAALLPVIQPVDDRGLVSMARGRRNHQVEIGRRMGKPAPRAKIGQFERLARRGQFGKQRIAALGEHRHATAHPL